MRRGNVAAVGRRQARPGRSRLAPGVVLEAFEHGLKEDAVVGRDSLVFGAGHRRCRRRGRGLRRCSRWGRGRRGGSGRRRLGRGGLGILLLATLGEEDSSATEQAKLENIRKVLPSRCTLGFFRGPFLLVFCLLPLFLLDLRVDLVLDCLGRLLLGLFQLPLHLRHLLQLDGHCRLGFFLGLLPDLQNLGLLRPGPLAALQILRQIGRLLGGRSRSQRC
mmetsp:Transcript_64380/g.166233  ORF Transcript_64380/g.166233 Transcript_64380/m.166233 type:complete len:219 (+) Transcript_64380:146-802(+)